MWRTETCIKEEKKKRKYISKLLSAENDILRMILSIIFIPYKTVALLNFILKDYNHHFVMDLTDYTYIICTVY